MLLNHKADDMLLRGKFEKTLPEKVNVVVLRLVHPFQRLLTQVPHQCVSPFVHKRSGQAKEGMKLKTRSLYSSSVLHSTIPDYGLRELMRWACALGCAERIPGLVRWVQKA